MCNFLNKAVTAYSKHATCMVEKLPQSNDFLKTVTAIDPVAILAKRTVTWKAILHLPDIVTNVLPSTDLEDYEKECRKIMVDPTLPPALVEKKFVRADTWWFKLKDKYLLLSKMSLALLTIFHGPRVESSFSVMGDVMDKKSGRMNVSTYSAIQTVKYSLNAKTSHVFAPKSVQVFQRSDWLKIPVMSEAVEGIRNSKKVYKNELAVSKTISTDLTAERVPKKRVLKTAFQVETSLKKKLKETNPVKNVQAKKSKASIQDIQETSTTIFSQPAANKTLLKWSHPGVNLDESVNTSKKKRVETSLNVYFKKWK